YVKVERRPGGCRARAGAGRLARAGKGAVGSAATALTNAGLTPVEAADAANFLAGKMPDENTLMAAARLAAASGAPGADRRGSAEYKREMARVLTARALRKAVERAGGA